MAFNYGQFQEEFHVVMAGSNAYVKEVDGATPYLPGYTTEVYKDGGAILAPLDCQNKDTYIGVKSFLDAKFDAQRCVALCTATKDCHFVNTYMLRKGAVPVSQDCALYTRRWPENFATNHGQATEGGDIAINRTDSYG
jgi:hypothetical protein